MTLPVPDSAFAFVNLPVPVPELLSVAREPARSRARIALCRS
jgi:hypothetical protein